TATLDGYPEAPPRNRQYPALARDAIEPSSEAASSDRAQGPLVYRAGDRRWARRPADTETIRSAPPRLARKTKTSFDPRHRGSLHKKGFCRTALLERFVRSALATAAGLRQSCRPCCLRNRRDPTPVGSRRGPKPSSRLSG